jgi:predicted GNAT family acetyltransferase
MSDLRTTEIRHHPLQGRIEAWLDGRHAGELKYRIQAGVMVILHTGVAPALQGQGIAAALVRFALAHARAHALKVRPLCGYVAAYVQRHPEERELLG